MNNVHLNIFVSYGQQAQAYGLEAELVEKPVVQVAATNATLSNLISKNLRLTPQELAAIRALQQHDQEVKLSEKARIAASRPALTDAVYTMELSSDGKYYASGRDVQINTPSANTLEETILKAQVTELALTPSSQNRNAIAQPQNMASPATADTFKINRQSQRLASQYQSDIATSPNNTWDTEA
ncbi:MAG: hypothetical protein P4L87_26150 [Formivibrio sp.]|nr:hypothetical protein [Formivibrio sp.]